MVMSKVTERSSSISRNDRSQPLPVSMKQNSKGGIYLSDEDVKAAFDFFDVKESGKITGNDLRERMQTLTRKLSNKEIKTILGTKESITLQEIKDIVSDNELSTDPYAEAFSILDPTGKGFISEERLKKIFLNLGFGELTEEELQLLVSTGDADKGKSLSSGVRMQTKTNANACVSTYTVLQYSLLQ